ncbi:hypothetical protein LTR17_016701 [Elasticomyces elasticus]|nr:hypothetical protein LTR17_016701 [Elasticomyces elasticus]
MAAIRERRYCLRLQWGKHDNRISASVVLGDEAKVEDILTAWWQALAVAGQYAVREGKKVPEEATAALLDCTAEEMRQLMERYREELVGKGWDLESNAMETGTSSRVRVGEATTMGNSLSRIASTFRGTATTSINQLATCTWWEIAKYLPLRDLHSLRLTSRQVEHEIHFPVLERTFRSVTIDASPEAHIYNEDYLLWEKEERAIRGAVQSLEMKGLHRLDHEVAESYRWADTLPPKLLPVGPNVCLPTTIGSFPKLKTLSVEHLNAELLSRHFEANALTSMLITQNIRVNDLELVHLRLGVDDVMQLLNASQDTVTNLSLTFDCLTSGKWVDLLSALKSLALETITISDFSVRLPQSGHDDGRRHFFPHINKWLSRTELYHCRAGCLTAQGKVAVDAGLQLMIDTWEAEYVWR